MKYQANPVAVDAFVIESIDRVDERGNLHIKVNGGDDHLIRPPLMARIRPVAGDYLVVQADGYTYLNPKAVFERKYSPVSEPVEIAVPQAKAALEKADSFIFKHEEKK